MKRIHSLAPKIATCGVAILLIAGITLPVYATHCSHTTEEAKTDLSHL